MAQIMLWSTSPGKLVETHRDPVVKRDWEALEPKHLNTLVRVLIVEKS